MYGSFYISFVAVSLPIRKSRKIGFPEKKGKKRNKNGCHLESIIEAHNGVVENAVVSEHFASSFWKFKLSRSRKKHKCFASVLYKKKSYAAAGRRKT